MKWLCLLAVLTSLCILSGSQTDDSGASSFHPLLRHLYHSNMTYHSLHGITVDPSSGKVVWLLEPCTNNMDNCNFYLPNIATLLSIQQNDNCMNRGLAFSLDPWNKFNIWGPHFRKVYYPLSCSSTLRESVAGAIMFSVDWDLKTLMSNQSLIRSVTGRNETMDDLLYSSSSKDDFNSSEIMVRVWMAAKRLEVDYSADLYSAFYGTVSLQVRACRLISNSSTYTGLSEKGSLPMAYQRLISLLNDRMDISRQLFPSFKRLEQLIVAHHAVQFIQARNGKLSSSYLSSIDYRVTDSSLKAPSVVTTSELFDSLRAVVSINQSSNVIYGPQHSSEVPLQIHGVVPIEKNDDSKVMVKVDYKCFLSGDSHLPLSSLITDNNISMSCNRLVVPVSERDAEKDRLPCEDAVGVKRKASLHSYMYFGSSVVRYQYSDHGVLEDRSITRYSVLGTLVHVKWHCSRNGTLFVDVDHDDSPDVALKGAIALVAITSKEVAIRSDGTDSACALKALLLQLQLLGVEGVVLGWNDKNVPFPTSLNISFGEKRDLEPLLQLPARLVPDKFLQEFIVFIRESTDLKQAEQAARHFSADGGGEGESPRSDALKLDVRVSLACDAGRMFDEEEIKESNEEEDTVDTMENNDEEVQYEASSFNASYGDSVYFTLDRAPIDGSQVGCQRNFLSLPEHLELVPPHPDILDEIVASHTWSTDALLLSDNVYYRTLMSVKQAGEIIQAGFFDVRTDEDSSSPGGGLKKIKPSVCNARILVRTISREVYQSGYLYRTLDLSPLEGRLLSGSCQSSPLPLPGSPSADSRWEVAPPTQEVLRYVVSVFPWGAAALVLQDGQGYRTSQSIDNATQLALQLDGVDMKMTVSIDPATSAIRYQPTACALRILIRRRYVLSDQSDFESQLNYIERKQVSRQYHMSLTQLLPSANGQYLIELSYSHRSLTHGGIDLTNVPVVVSDVNRSVPAGVDRGVKEQFANIIKLQRYFPSQTSKTQIRDPESGRIYHIHDTA